MPERAVLSCRRCVFASSRAFSMVLVSVAARDSGVDDSRIRNPAGA